MSAHAEQNGGKCSKKDVQQMMADADLDGDGMISLEEFANCYTKVWSPSLIFPLSSVFTF
jgi:Ca2+-binding EF-hand superfamily protein